MLPRITVLIYDSYITSKCIQKKNGKKYAFVKSVVWFTNLETPKRREKIELYKKYTPEEYPKYDNYNAINIDKVSEIPEDYYGEMGVPVTFLHKYNPEQFEIVRFRKGDDGKDLRVNGKYTYFRILIRRRQFLSTTSRAQ